MKLILAIISNDDSTALIRGLNKESYQVTKLATTGGSYVLAIPLY